jgi:hypothetical protein
MPVERRCTVSLETKMYKTEPCNGRILRREPVISSEAALEYIHGPKDIKEGKGGSVRYYLYECENGHILNRPEGWADVPTVPPGTIKSIHGTVNKPQKWYLDLPEDESEN